MNAEGAEGSKVRLDPRATARIRSRDGERDGWLHGSYLS